MSPARRLLITGLLFAGVAFANAADLQVALKTAKGEPVTDAVASLTPLDGTALPDLATPPPVLEIAQQGQEYLPYVTPLRVGTRVEFPNRDQIQHHLYSLSKAKRFEKPLYAPGAHESVLFDQPGVVTLGCNIHDWMIAYVVVLPTPYFAKTGPNGGTTLAGVPAGRYRLEIWHPRLTKPDVRELTLTDGGAREEISLALKTERRIRRAPESSAGGY